MPCPGEPMNRLALSLVALALAATVSNVLAEEAKGAESAEQRPKLNAAAREYLLQEHFKSAPQTLDGALEFLEMPPSIREHCAAEAWEKGQLEKFGVNRQFFLARCPDGKTRAFHFRGDERRNERELTPAQVRVLRRLYSDAAFTAPPPAEFARVRERGRLQGLDETLLVARARCEAAGFKLDEATLARLDRNQKADTTRRGELALALSALAECENAGELCWAALWTISRMDAMSFAREDRSLSKGDLATVEARAFFENVYYAVKARREMPWGRSVSERDFLHHVLSPRGTGEPAQRWRRQFYEALAPELKDVKDPAEAIKLATDVVYSFFQYEGDTTWEDFGMLTALAVHEGRCEDCSNVENCMLRAVGLPACQAYTPWWGNGDGNHAWTEIPGLRKVSGDGTGGGAVKIFIKTWDGLDDVTDQYVTVTRLEVAATGDGQASLNVFNHEQWRTLARTPVAQGKALFEKIGCRKPFALVVKVEGMPDRAFAVETDKSVRPLLSGQAQDGLFEARFEKQCVLGEFRPDKPVKVQVWSADGWQEVSAQRVSTGAIQFMASQDCLYRLVGEGLRDRPFTLTQAEGTLNVTQR
ncbi:transglutaminase domain-containing protein [bacterium]|nr:MAG: transglutaminase domain-containing protein [bacterium]